MMWLIHSDPSIVFRATGLKYVRPLVILLFPYFISFVPTSADLLSLSPPVEPLFYFYPFHQNFLIHMLFFYFLHSLVHSLLNPLFNKHSLKAIHLFTIKYFQVGYLIASLDLNVL